MEYEVMRFNGKSVALKTPYGSIALDENKRADGNRYWSEFLAWNAKQPVPLDLSDKEPESARVMQEDEVDFTPAERKAIRALLTRR